MWIAETLYASGQLACYMTDKHGETLAHTKYKLKKILKI